MNGRIVVLGGWRAYALAAVVLALLLAFLFVASVLALTLIAVGAVAFAVHRALRALGLARATPRRPRGPAGVIEAEYRVVERPLPEPPRADRAG